VFRSFFFYKVIPLILLLGLFHALYMLLKELTEGCFDRKKIITAAVMLLTIYLWKMPSVATGFYWFTGAITYQVPNILTLYLCACIVRMHRTQQTKRIPLILLSVLLVVAIVGANETSMMLWFLLLMTMLSLSVFSYRRVNWMLLVLLVATIIGIYFLVSAPGNYERMQHSYPHKQNLMFAVKSSIKDTLRSIGHWGFSWHMAGGTIFFIYLASQVAEKRIRQGSRFLIHPLFLLIALICLLIAGFMPGYYVRGDIAPPRTINVIHLYFILGWFINVYFLTELWIRKNQKISVPLGPYYAIIMLCFLISYGFSKDNNIKTAYADLLSGKSSRYNQELANRYKLLAECPRACEVSKLENIPMTIYFDDIIAEADNWRNKEYAKYFNKETIVLKAAEGQPL
jgi:hypothetical protein